MGKVIYLTGAPSSGKSSTSRLLVARVPNLRVWEYGAKLTEYVQRRGAPIENQAELRSKSASAVTVADVEAVDRELLKFVEAERATSNILIDSHAVTKEEFGFRVIPFSLEQFARLRPDEVWMLFINPAAATDRIANDPAGRPLVDQELARMHTLVQAGVASAYAMSLGIPLYLFDASIDQSALVARLLERLS